MAKEKKNFQTVIVIQENIRPVNLMVKANIFGQMVIPMKVDSKKVHDRVMEY